MVAPVVALNQIGSKGFVLPEIIPHSEYLKDPWFWVTQEEHLGVIDVLTGHLRGVNTRLNGIPLPSYQQSGAARFYTVTPDDAARFPDHYKITV